MTPIDYRVAFDILEAGYRQWWFPALGVAFIIFGLLFLRYRKWMTLGAISRYASLPRWFGRIWIGFACVWTVFSFAMTLFDYVSLRNAMVRNEVELVEGVVTNFIPMPESGHAEESFKVAGKRFSYSDFSVNAGFNNTKSHGGPIDEGVNVRIWHIGNRIARLEVADPNGNR